MEMNMIIDITPSSSFENRKSTSVGSNCMFNLSMWRSNINEISREKQYIIKLVWGVSAYCWYSNVPDHTFYTAHQKALDEIHICVTWRV